MLSFTGSTTYFRYSSLKIEIAFKIYLYLYDYEFINAICSSFYAIISNLGVKIMILLWFMES